MKLLKNNAVKILRRMIRVRNLQWLIACQIHKGNVDNPVHLALGHEMIACIAAEYLNPDVDCVCLPHRNLHFNLALTEKFDEDRLERVVKEIISDPNGCDNGGLGSMNFANRRACIHYTSSILANCLGFACGRALSSKRRGTGKALAVLGDGAMEEGRFWEASIFAAAHELNIIFIVENNGWSMQSAISQRRSTINLSQLADSLGVEYLNFDALHTSVEEAAEVVAKAFNIVGPVILEVQVETFGSKLIEEAGTTRLVNYHAGKIMIGEATSFSGQFNLSSRDQITFELLERLGIAEKTKSEFQLFQKVINQ